MSTIFLHVGQCGNQLAQCFWQEAAGWQSPPRPGTVPSTSRSVPSGKTSYSSSKTKSKSSPSTSACPYSLLDGTLPCVLVDTEPKVIRKCTAEGTQLGKTVPPDFRVVERKGRGNNWAYGYFAATKKELVSSRQAQGLGFGVSTREQERLVDIVQERVRRLVEKCDRFGGFVQLHSIAGGTGSGVGSAVIEQLREDYPLSYILSVSVAPFSHGETPLQHYNSLLCLHRLQTHTDGVLLFQNDHVLTQALKCTTASMSGSSGSQQGRLGPTSGTAAVGSGVSVEDMNRHMSSTLCNTLLPIWNARQKVPPLSGGEMWELIRSVCPDPGLKFMLPSHCQLSRPTHTWDNAVSAVTGSYRSTVASNFPVAGAPSDPQTGSVPSKPATTSLVAICRASPTAMTSLVSNTSSLEKRLRQTYNTVQWNPFPVDFWLSYEPHLRDRKVVSVLANTAAVAGYLQHVMDRARLMYSERAYLHWFERYGCERGMFEEAFQTVQGIVDNYRAL